MIGGDSTHLSPPRERERERERAPEAPCEQQTPYIHHSRGTLHRDPACTRAVATMSCQMRAHDDGGSFLAPFRSRPDVDTLGKHRLGPHPFKSETSKPLPPLPPNSCKAPKASAKIIFFTSNLRQLRFYQNKRLSLDKRYGVPNTFTMRKQTSRLKN